MFSGMVSSETPDILLIDTTERVRTLTLNRPQSRNALSAELRKRFFGALADAESDGDVDVVIVPVGGGGLISGVAAAVRHVRPGTRIIGVEPVGAAAVTAGMKAGGVQPLERVDTIADGLGAPMTGELVLEHVRALVDEIVTVTDRAIAQAMRSVITRARLLVEPAGAAAYAAIESGAVDVRGATTAIILSGGNVDLERFKELV